MTDTPGTPLTPECVFVPPNEPWTCSGHQGVRTSLDEPQCDIARPAEPFNDAHLDNLRTAIAEGRNPGSRYNVRRLLATLDRERRERVDPDLLAAEQAVIAAAGELVFVWYSGEEGPKYLALNEALVRLDAIKDRLTATDGDA